MHKSSILATVGVLTVFVLALVGMPLVRADMYFNSAEPGCDGSNSNVLFCDDFEDGDWYTMNCDQANNPTTNPAGNGLLVTDGWCGTIYANPITPTGAAVCGSQGVAGTNCAATTGLINQAQGGKNMADHAFVGGQGTQDVYVRYYYKADTGYQWGTEKALTFNDGTPGGGGIRWGNFAFSSCGAGGLVSPAPTTIGIPGVPSCLNQNQGNNILINPGRWYAIQLRMRLSDPGQANGIFELWIDDCGSNGLDCSGTPTLRQRNTTIQHTRTASELIRVLWWENWGNPASSGTAYYDNIKVATTGPIGFVGTTPTRRTGDLNGDGTVNINDVILIIQNFKRRMNYDVGADINNDGVVNIFDMVLLGRNWGDGTAIVFNPLSNRPAGYANVQSDYGFSGTIPASYGDASFGDGSGWYSVFNAANKTYRAVDASGSISSGYVLESEYTAGQGTPTSSAGFGKIFLRPGSAKSAWYISFSIWHDPNFEFNAVSNKMLAIWPRGYGSQILESRHFSDDFLAWQFEDVAGVPYYPANTAFGESFTNSFFRGNWVNVEVEYKPGVTDGEIRVWAGRNDGTDGSKGQLVSEYTGIYVPEINSANEISLDTTWGGGNGPTTRTSYRRIDHVYIAHP